MKRGSGAEKKAHVVKTDGAAARRHALAAESAAHIAKVGMAFGDPRFAKTGPSTPPKGGAHGRSGRKLLNAARRERSVERMLGETTREATKNRRFMTSKS